VRGTQPSQEHAKDGGTPFSGSKGGPPAVHESTEAVAAIRNTEHVEAGFGITFFAGKIVAADSQFHDLSKDQGFALPVLYACGMSSQKNAT
jgi:hypothetical protein